MREYSKKMAIYDSESRSSSNNKHASTLILDSLLSRTLRNELLMFVYGIYHIPWYITAIGVQTD